MRNLILLSVLAASFQLISCTKDSITNKVPVADAGPYTQTEFPNSATLKGSGSDADGAVVGYLWSQVSGPAESSLVNPGDSITTVAFPTYGNYQFQLMVIDNEGATGLDTVSVLVTKPPVDSISLTSSDPSYMDLTFAGNANSNYTDPTTPEIGLADWTLNGGDDVLRAALQFNLGNLPSTTKVLSAKLSLFSNPHPINGNQIDANYGPTNAFYVRRITQSWNYLTAGWFTQPPTTTEGQIYVPQTNQARLDIIDLDVTTLVQAMITNGNHGFFLQLETEQQYNSRIFCSSRYPDASKHPVLQIVYQK